MNWYCGNPYEMQQPALDWHREGGESSPRVGLLQQVHRHLPESSGNASGFDSRSLRRALILRQCG